MSILLIDIKYCRFHTILTLNLSKILFKTPLLRLATSVLCWYTVYCKPTSSIVCKTAHDWSCTRITHGRAAQGALRCRLDIKKKHCYWTSCSVLQYSAEYFCDPSGPCESGVILLIFNLLVDIIEKQCTTVCTTFSALFWRAKLPWFITTCESITKLTLIIRIFAK